MTQNVDPVDEALHVLRSRDWNVPDHRARLKETLMQEFEPQRAASRRRRTLIAAGACVVALGSVGFVAADRMGLLPWHVTTEVNGKVVDQRDVTPDENGQASFTVDTERGAADVIVTQSPDGQKQISVELSGGDGDSATVQVRKDE